MYSPTLGRWIQNDPIEFTAGDPNLYRMEGNDPTGMVDPSGLCGDDGKPNESIPAKLDFSGPFTPTEEDILKCRLASALKKLTLAHTLLTTKWPELKDKYLEDSVIPGAQNTFLSPTYKKLNKPALQRYRPFSDDTLGGVGVTVRNEYALNIKRMLNEMNDVKCTIALKRVTKANEAPGTEGGEAYVPPARLNPLVPYFDVTTSTIHIRDAFFDRIERRQIDIMMRELARRQGYYETGTGRVHYDADEWGNILDDVCSRGAHLAK